MRLLIVEDEDDLRQGLEQALREQGYAVDVAADGKEGLYRAETWDYDVVILDVMLPEMDGWEVCKEIRRFEKTPIIMLTGKGESRDKLKGFDLGADDYLVKPFDPNELMARIKAVLRRANPLFDADAPIEFPSLKIDLQHYQVTCETQEIVFPPREMELLYFLASQANHVFTRQQLLDRLWGLDFEGDPRTVDVHIKRIREKVGDSHPYWRVKTIRGVGYKFEVENQ